MAQQEEGWPLGLRLLNARAEMVRNRDLTESVSSTTLLTGSSISSTDSSSDLDLESTGSFFHNKSITLGSLIGVSSILELSRRSARVAVEDVGEKKRYKSKRWFFSLCSNLSGDAVRVCNNNTPPLSHFLEAERRAANNYRSWAPNMHGVSHFSSMEHVSATSSLSVGGRVAHSSLDKEII